MAPAKEKDGPLLDIAKSLNNVPWCEEYEKMVSGMLYNSFEPELAAGRWRARRIVHKYNNHFPDDVTPEALVSFREGLLRELVGKVGNDVYIEPPLNVDYGCNISLGDRFYANFNTVILDCSVVIIGNRVMFGPSVSIYAATHETGVQSRRANIEYAHKVVIGDDCWIGGNSTILAGVSIGEGCTVGAGSVVTKDVPPFSVVAGCPARIIKKVELVPPI